MLFPTSNQQFNNLQPVILHTPNKSRPWRPHTASAGGLLDSQLRHGDGSTIGHVIWIPKNFMMVK